MPHATPTSSSFFSPAFSRRYRLVIASGPKVAPSVNNMHELSSLATRRAWQTPRCDGLELRVRLMFCNSKEPKNISTRTDLVGVFVVPLV
jgi:hypothetical protein